MLSVAVSGTAVPTETTSYTYDAIGQLLTETKSTGFAATYTYDAFGAVLSSSGAWQGSHGYAGGFGYQEEAESGLKLLGHRYYDSSTGRFLSRDPIKDGRNWYAYCEGNPVSLADPDGNIPILVVIGIILIVAEIVDAASDVKDIYDNPSDPVPYISLMLGAIDPSPGNIGKRFAKGGLRIAKESMRHADDVVDVGKRLPVLNPNRPARMGMETPDRSWTTSRRNHWKMRAREDGASDYYGEANVERMKKGLAPKNQAGKSMELDHYPVPRRDGGKEFIERWPEEHALHDPFRHL